MQHLKRWLHPENFVQKDKDAVYKKGKIKVGLPRKTSSKNSSREHTICIVGAQFGDEGKGRFVDNKLQALLRNPKIKKAYVIRYQGGSNAGHTIYTEDGTKIALHQVPSSILEERAIGIMDAGMVIHLEDLKTEIEDAEVLIGDLNGRLMLSEEAKLCTDLERAEEVLNRIKSSGKSDGGTGRGISPTYANHYSRLGLTIRDFFASNWKEKLSARYDRYANEFKAYDLKLSECIVPDFRTTRRTKSAQKRTVGTKKEYLDRLDEVRDWYLSREKNLSSEKKLIQNTFLIHQQILSDKHIGVLFEGAQAVGLHAHVGRLPDVTASDTSVYGVTSGTQGSWIASDIQEKIGVFKVTYMSSVGSARMPTDLHLPREQIDSTKGLTKDQIHGLWIREEAHERGTTTGRYRDICLLDLAIMRFNIRVGGIERLAGTHLDIAKKDEPVKVCTHYVDQNTGEVVPYQAGIEYQKNIEPVYVELPGWDGKKVQAAKSFAELPKAAQQFLAFIQLQTGTPIVAVTTGPERRHLITME